MPGTKVTRESRRGVLEDRTGLKRKRKESERKAQLAHPLNRPRGYDGPEAVFGEVHPSLSISSARCCDWLVAFLPPRAYLRCMGFTSPKYKGPTLWINRSCPDSGFPPRKRYVSQ